MDLEIDLVKLRPRCAPFPLLVRGGVTETERLRSTARFIGEPDLDLDNDLDLDLEYEDPVYDE